MFTAAPLFYVLARWCKKALSCVIVARTWKRYEHPFRSLFAIEKCSKDAVCHSRWSACVNVFCLKKIHRGFACVLVFPRSQRCAPLGRKFMLMRLMRFMQCLQCFSNLCEVMRCSIYAMLAVLCLCDLCGVYAIYAMLCNCNYAGMRCRVYAVWCGYAMLSMQCFAVMRVIQCRVNYTMSSNYAVPCSIYAILCHAVPCIAV